MTYHWSHLPNAALVDEVLTSLKAHPKKWSAAWATAWVAPWSTARFAACSTARATAWDAVRATARVAAQAAAWDAVRAAARAAALDAAWDAVMALTAYDDAGQFMKLPIEQLKAMHKLDPHPMYLLLQPAAVVFTGGEQ